MKFKVLFSIFMLLVCSLSFGQDFKNDLTSLKTIDNQIIEEQYNTNEVVIADRLVVQTSVDNISEEDKRYYSKKEWKKIKKAILRNKKRVNAKKNSIHAFKLMDTIFLKHPSGVNVKESSLSAW